MRLITLRIFGWIVFFFISAFGWSQEIKSFNHNSTLQTDILPTLTMTEITPVNLSANIGNSDSETLNVSAVNVSSDVSITLSGTNADQFSISQNNLTFSVDSVPDTVISVTYTPNHLGLHNATLTFSSPGASDVIRSITGVSGLDVPLANEPTSISSTGFTANWTAVNGATAYLLDVYTKPSGTAIASDLIISEYVVGSSYNKAIGLFKSGIQIDKVGVFNQTADCGKEVNLVRKASVISPKIPYDNGEWHSFASDDTDRLGTHNLQPVIDNVAPITGSPFTVNGTNSYLLSGLTSGITYYYTVKAVNGTYNTVPSNEMSVNLLQTEWKNPQNEPKIIIMKGKIQIETHQVNTALMIFNGLGQMLISRSISEGLNVIHLAYHGVIFVKLGDKVTKGIL